MLTKVMVRDYHPTFTKEAIILASSILNNPEDLYKYIDRSAASATMSILYDYPTLEDEHDKNIAEIHRFVNRMSTASAPGAHLVELFPWMMYIPERYVLVLYIIHRCDVSRWDPRFARWKREGLEHFRQHTTMFNRLLNAVYDDIVSRQPVVLRQTISK